MNKFKKLDSLDRIHILSEPRRRKILKMLMTQPRTISQIGREIGEFPAGIRYHIKKLEQADLVELSEIKVSAGYTEKFYQAKSQAIILQSLILPFTSKKTTVFMGSHDLAFEILVSTLEKKYTDISILSLPIGSLDGLISLRQGVSKITGCHIFDPDTGLYNSPFIKRILPDRLINLITLAHREQGLILPHGNPKHITGLDALARKDIVIINRNPGSGTRIWFDRKLGELGVITETINGYTQEVSSHSAVAHSVKSGMADVGLGLNAAASQEDLDFIPLFIERYDLVIPESSKHDMTIKTLLNFLTSSEYRQAISALKGYDSSKTGESHEVK